MKWVLLKIPFSIGEYILDICITLPYIEYLGLVEDSCVLKIVSSDPMNSGASYKSETAPFYIENFWIEETSDNTQGPLSN